MNRSRGRRMARFLRSCRRRSCRSPRTRTSSHRSSIGANGTRDTSTGIRLRSSICRSTCCTCASSDRSGPISCCGKRGSVRAWCGPPAPTCSRRVRTRSPPRRPRSCPMPVSGTSHSFRRSRRGTSSRTRNPRPPDRSCSDSSCWMILPTSFVL